MVSEKTRLIVAALLTGIPFGLAAKQEPFSGVSFVLLFGSLLGALVLFKEYRQYQSE
ncbi:hypothetical protein [Haloprofundus halobius]|uniref:hypothetical protein n=1 Tax=Haloprofundus halobius TaxID=2876194 RepID=UPI001CC913A1|nr:hypothetical protein [Haloprofundus halobius]